MRQLAADRRMRRRDGHTEKPHIIGSFILCQPDRLPDILEANDDQMAAREGIQLVGRCGNDQAVSFFNGGSRRQVAQQRRAAPDGDEAHRVGLQEGEVRDRALSIEQPFGQAEFVEILQMMAVRYVMIGA